MKMTTNHPVKTAGLSILDTLSAYMTRFRKPEIHFSERETEIIHLIAMGFGSKQIAVQLFISKHTVDTHRKNIYRKGKFNNLRDVILFALFNEVYPKNTH